ncbi:MAG: hypothetical protein GF341_01990 [candidate division Zixibacteria bacterium]|nr:hypothetical protein [candidate division Zixibacteria bacterium]
MPRIPNIGPKERRRRALTSIPMMIVAVGLGAYMVLENWDPAFRLLVALPLWLSLLGLFQAKEKT